MRPVLASLRALALLLVAALGLAPAAPAQPRRPVSQLLSRPSAPPARAYAMRLSENWRLDGDLPVHAMLLSLQGLANRDAARLYFLYPETWAFSFTGDVYQHYKTRYGIAFDSLATPDEALDRLASHAKGYVVWDDSVRASLLVAFTVAGLEDALVVNERLVPLVEARGLRRVDDLRGRYRRMRDAQIYADAWQRYGDRTSKDFVTWIGGMQGAVMEPGVADFGIAQRTFFTDLSADPEDAEEYALTDRIFSTMHTGALVMGWHAYGKDTEGQFVTLVSHHALRMEGLNTLPDLSFNSRIPVTPGYAFRTNHRPASEAVLTPGKTVYVAAVQTDGLGLGAWNKPGRGSIPYAWEVTMNWQWLCPAVLQYFFEQATPNDSFIGMLSGPGYMYPKPIPRDKLPLLIDEARQLMTALDLRVFEIMDYSEGTRTQGNLDLPKEIVDAYYAGMPDAMGFLNGYGAANTFDLRGGRPFLSFDYYLGESRPTEEAVSDLEELARMNAHRPAFLLVHVREWSTVEHVADIFSRLGPEFQVLPLETFLRLAARHPDVAPRYARPDRPRTGPMHAPGSVGARAPRR